MSTENIKIFSKRLRELRGDASQAKFARKLGICNPSTYFGYEHGRVPNTEIVKAIAARCDVSVDWLLGSEGGRVVREAGVSYGTRTIPLDVLSDSALSDALGRCIGGGRVDLAAVLASELARRKGGQDEKAETDRDPANAGGVQRPVADRPGG
jgi:transcriptional regulator with XRE-family HTH domain